jgi:hypothetical protein
MICLVEAPHFVKIRCGEAGNTWDFELKVHGQVLHHAAPPGLSRLALDNKTADVPVEVDEVPVHSTESCILGRSDSLFDFAQQCPYESGGRVLRVFVKDMWISHAVLRCFCTSAVTRLSAADLPSNQFHSSSPRRSFTASFRF